MEEKEQKREDLRITKTHSAIRKALADMICDMDWEQISVKELCARAMINRKTFYLHYESLDSLLQELQDEIADKFISKKISYKSLSDIKSIIRVYFETTTNLPKMHERLLCSGNYQHISDRITKRVMAHRLKENKGAFGLDEARESLVFSYFTINSGNLYRQWVSDGKKLSLDELIEMATKLICYGMSSVVEGK